MEGSLDCVDMLNIKCRSTANDCFNRNENNTLVVPPGSELILVKYLTSKVN